MAIYDINGNQLSGSASASGAANCLSGKTLCCAGDSLTAGGGVSGNASLTYGGICAKNNSMTYTNMGTNGATLTTCNPTNNFMLRYESITEHDYLTFWFGFNDSRYGRENLKDIYCQEHYGADYYDCTAEQRTACDAAKDWTAAFVGEIDGTDAATWCGAWNTVLTHFTQTYPDMHIGVILPVIAVDALKEPMRDALVTLCKKYGVAYIDSMDANDWCSFGFTEGLSSEMKAYYLTTRTGDGYLHPNERAYRIMANQFTEFLCGI